MLKNNAFTMKKIIFFILFLFLILRYIGTHSFFYNENKEDALLSEIYQYENYFNNRNGQNTNILIENLIDSAQKLYHQYPTEKNKAIYYGIVYGLGQSQYYEKAYMNNINANTQKDFFLEHYCLIQPRSIINTISEPLKKAINNSDFSSCKDMIKDYKDEL